MFILYNTYDKILILIDTNSKTQSL